MRGTKAERFWAKVEKTDECWLWAASLFVNDGYGQFDGQGAHRVSWELAYGPIPEGQQVLHKCDNRPCIRPDHLFLGTHLDNMRDMALKGRSLVGERNPKAKLTLEAVSSIRANVEGLSLRAAARKHGVSFGMIGHIRRGANWQSELEDVK